MLSHQKGSRGEFLIEIFRYIPKRDIKPRYERYRLSRKEITVLQALQYIYTNIDGTLTFRHYHCKRGNVCGSCAMLINGKRRLACKTPVRSEMIIEPLPSRKVIRDLVVDFRESTEDK